MRERVRLIIPLWGAVYAKKLVSMTIPALLAPGNLPALRTMFDVEFVVVTEASLFDSIRRAPSFQLLSTLCQTKFVALDDLLTDLPGDYGVVLTYALFRGFADLGPAMTETYLLFLNADFIISNGSYAHLGKLMRKGLQVIHAPSFRAVLEDVWPVLQSQVDRATSTLSMGSREMVRLALAHKHVTVRARTVNQQLCHQWRMDQFYWYVDEDTLIGYQWPVALVAIKPQRVVTEPVLVWDYGFIPEAAPTAEKHFIADSDDFFMLEPQRRTSGDEMIRLGGISIKDIARDLSRWTTREQRYCGQQLLTFHASELPANTGPIIAESRSYIARIVRELSTKPQPHIGHGLLSEWFEVAKDRMKGASAWGPDGDPSLAQSVIRDAGSPSLPRAVANGNWRAQLAKSVNAGLRRAYQVTFGKIPDVRAWHPLWADTHAIVAALRYWRRDGDANILWLSSRDSLFDRLLSHHIDPAALLMPVCGQALKERSYDGCLCELTMDEFARLRSIYARVRPLMKDGAQVLVSVVNRSMRVMSIDDVLLFDGAFPDVDTSTIKFYGSGSNAILRRWYLKASRSFQNSPVLRGILTGVVLIGLAPFAWVANHGAAARGRMTAATTWTSLLVDLTVKRRLSPAAVEQEPEPRVSHG
jgi:hypothetical protein